MASRVLKGKFIPVLALLVTSLIVIGVGTLEISQGTYRNGVKSLNTTSGPVTPLSQCDSNFPSGLPMVLNNGTGNRTSIPTRVLIVHPGVTAAICVEYYVGSNNVTANDFPVSIFKVNATPIYDSKHDISGYYWSYSKAQNVSVVSNAAPSLAKASLPGFVTVVYTITATSNGYYGLAHPGSCPVIVPLAIVGPGETPSASNFPGFFWPSSCPQGGGAGIRSSEVTGYTGISTIWLGG